MKVAVVHDWLTGMRGGEHCLERVLRLYPNADIYTMLHWPGRLSPALENARVIASKVNKLPGVQGFYRYLLPFFPQVAREVSKEINSRNYDLVISVSHAWAKNIKVDAPHLSYCLTPMRYIWDQYEAYFEGRKIEPVARVVAGRLRDWDRKGAQRVDAFSGISEFIQERIKGVYSKDSKLIYPPVSQDWIRLADDSQKGEGFLLVNALVPYKNTDLVIRAFNNLGAKLKIVGTGPEQARLKALAGENIEFLGWVSQAKLAELYRSSRALIFAAREDFGITPVEAQAAGRPVIAYGAGGALETVTGGETGVFFEELSEAAIEAAVEEFNQMESSFDKSKLVSNAKRFLPENFDRKFARWVFDFAGSQSLRVNE